jgi:hypothetical protein
MKEVIREVNSKIKHKNKIMDNENKMLIDMMYGKFTGEVGFNKVRKIIKKIIWDLAMNIVNKGDPMWRAMNNQIMTFYRFGSSLHGKKQIT